MGIPINNLGGKQIVSVGAAGAQGGTYFVVSLSTEHIDSILALQEVIFSSLPEAEQNFLLRKDKAFFEKHFSCENTVLGVVLNGELVAQSIILNPTDKNPKTGMVDMALDTDINKITVIQGVVVHPDHQRKGLMTSMVDVWLDMSEKEGRTQALAEVAVDNYRSWKVFLREGMHIDSIGQDPSDGVNVYNVRAAVKPLNKRRLKDTFNKVSAKNCIPSDSSDLKKQKDLLSKGYKGVGYDSSDNVILFKAPPKSKSPKQLKK